MSESTSDFGRYLVEYSFGNSTYSIVIPARSWEEAQERIKRIGAFGRVIGSDVMTVPASLGWLAKLIVWWRNITHAGA
jgi:hypothetical protein